MRVQKPFVLMFLGLCLAGVAQLMAVGLQVKIDSGKEFGTCKQLDQDGVLQTYRLDEKPCQEAVISEWPDMADASLPLSLETSETLFWFKNKTVIKRELTNIMNEGAVKILDLVSDSIEEMKKEDFQQKFSDWLETPEFENSATYAVNPDSKKVEKIFSGRNLSMYLIIGQYAVLTLAEILISITALEFAYTQSSESMKTVCNALWCLTQSFGNVLIILLKTLESFSRKDQLLLCAVIAFVTAFFFVFLCKMFNIMSPEEIEENLNGGEDYNLGKIIPDVDESRDRLADLGNSKSKLLGSNLVYDTPITIMDTSNLSMGQYIGENVLNSNSYLVKNEKKSVS